MRFRLLKVILCIAFFFLMIGCTSRKDIEGQNIDANEDSHDKVVDGIMFEVSQEPNPPYTEGKVYTEVVYQEELEDVAISVSGKDRRFTIEDIEYAEIVYSYSMSPEMLIVDFTNDLDQKSGILWVRDAGKVIRFSDTHISSIFSWVPQGMKYCFDGAVGWSDTGYFKADGGIVFKHNSSDTTYEIPEEIEERLAYTEKNFQERRVKFRDIKRRRENN
ncbi:hypothetical protein [Ohessyouella blattaphilus]|uniref:Lipoprotein n=1 Tax=Ohessyouella blattaphilus TaxID=2949333 RepID=A0ABT1EJM3_9FIRM|nr:hypothetical protein [Ohessyouella blattaphilus]MCP1109502.1 hypothetical protein [Ohessyouella blattaphilus]MCR8562896.1 hypothetical protein [Ohessyouella blattaphilus]MDL2250111.1 hypothetical protein [Lachnospiraceae bacterium OttesenSCG-928-J05]